MRAPEYSKAQGVGPLGIASAIGRSGFGSQAILAHQIQQLLGTVPPAGLSHQLLSLWLERHGLRIDFITALLRHLAADCGVAA
jgi:hypothetical protein